MEAHPIPQNVTSFEFHLIGDMTLKQFGYLSTGIVLAYLIFIFFVTTIPFIAWPLIVLLSGFGTLFAFVPIQERPLDYWVVAFVRAILRPTKIQFKSKHLSVDNPLFDNRLIIYLNHLIYPNSSPPLIAAPQTVMNPQPNTIVPKPIVGPPPAPPSNNPKQEGSKNQPAPSTEDLTQTVELAKEAQSIQTEIIKTESSLNQIKTSAALPGADPKSFTEQFQRVLNDLQVLNHEASEVSKKLATLSQEVGLPTNPPAGGPPQLVLKPQPAPVKARSATNIILTTTPNIINGIIIDAQGNYVEGAIIVTHDKQGIPVRALKSNKLGQYIAATPLSNGTYTISVEKDSLVFDTVEILLKGQVLSPIIVSAKRSERTIL